MGEPYYKQGEVLLAEKKYDEAYDAFAKASGYKDADNRVLQSKYDRAINYMQSKEYEKAFALLEQISGYQDSDRQLALGELRCISEASKGTIVRFGRKEWYIINKNGEKALLLCTSLRKVAGFGNNIWETSGPREYLNTSFINDNFSSIEQQCILTTKVSNVKNKIGLGGTTTEDKIFIFNEQEAKQYSSYLFTLASSVRGEYYSRVFLRTPDSGGNGEYQIKTVQASDTELRFDSYMTYGNRGYVAPVMWVDTEALQ